MRRSMKGDTAGMKSLRRNHVQRRNRGTVTTPFPDWVEPMAATLTQERFTGPEWIFERKLDGIRLLAFKQGQDVRLLSRNRLPQSIPSLVEAIATLPVHDAILDGEVTWGLSTRRAGAVREPPLRPRSGHDTVA